MPQDTVLTRFGVAEEASYGVTPASALQLINLSEFPEFTRTRNTATPPVIGAADPRRPFKSRVLQEDGNLVLNSGLQFGNMRLLWEGLLMTDKGTATATLLNDTSARVGTNNATPRSSRTTRLRKRSSRNCCGPCTRT